MVICQALQDQQLRMMRSVFAKLYLVFQMGIGDIFSLVSVRNRSWLAAMREIEFLLACHSDSGAELSLPLEKRNETVGATWKRCIWNRHLESMQERILCILTKFIFRDCGPLTSTPWAFRRRWRSMNGDILRACRIRMLEWWPMPARWCPGSCEIEEPGLFSLLPTIPMLLCHKPHNTTNHY